jgi:hypothetical protein
VNFIPLVTGFLKESISPLPILLFPRYWLRKMAANSTFPLSIVNGGRLCPSEKKKSSMRITYSAPKRHYGTN